MTDVFRNKYEKEAHEIVEGLRGTKWEAAVSADHDYREVTGARTSGLLFGMLALALLAVWRLR